MTFNQASDQLKQGHNIKRIYYINDGKKVWRIIYANNMDKPITFEDYCATDWEIA
jgi:hypothetical protein